MLILSVFCPVLKELDRKKTRWLLHTQKNQDHISCSFSDKLVCVDNKFSKPIVFYRDESAA